MADREPETLRNALREHVNALAVDIGPRTPLDPNSLVRAANYIHSVFENAGLSVREQDYQYYESGVTRSRTKSALKPATSGYPSAKDGIAIWLMGGEAYASAS